MSRFYDDYQDAVDDLFNRAGDPVLKAGYASADYQATKEQMAEAAQKLEARAAIFAWRPLAADEAAVAAILRLLERECLAERRAGRPAEEASAQHRARRRHLRRQAKANMAAAKVLAFYREALLVHVPADPGEAGEDGAVARAAAPAARFVAYRTGRGWTAVRLDGQAEFLGELNSRAGFRFARESVEEYLGFVCTHVHVPGSGGLFPIEYAAPPRLPFPDLYLHASDKRVGERLKDWDPGGDHVVAEVAQPVTLLDIVENEAVLLGTIFFDNRVARAVFLVTDRGEVDLLLRAPVDAYPPPLEHPWLPPAVAGPPA